MRKPFQKPRLRHLNHSGYFQSGNPRFYYRPKGQKGIALPDLPPDNPKWLAAYVAASGVIPRIPAMSGSIAAGVIAYKESDVFLGLAKSTREYRQRALDDISVRYGSGQLRDLKPEYIEMDMDRFKNTAQNSRLKVWRGFCNFLYDKRLLRPNPAKDVPKRKVQNGNGKIPWTNDEIWQYRGFWAIGTPQRLAFELLYWTAARCSDVIGLGEQKVDSEGWLNFIQVKTGGKVSIPMVDGISDFTEIFQRDFDFVRQAISARNERHLTYITTQTGKARSIKSFSSWFAHTVRQAGIENRSAHGLRKSRAIQLVYAQATHLQIGAWTGHKSLKEIEEYTEQYERKLALSGSKWEQKVPTSPIQFQIQPNNKGKSNG